MGSLALPKFRFRTPNCYFVENFIFLQIIGSVLPRHETDKFAAKVENGNGDGLAMGAERTFVFVHVAKCSSRFGHDDDTTTTTTSNREIIRESMRIINQE